MLQGLMMETKLTITSLMRFAERVYPRSEIVSITADNEYHRYTYKEAFARTRQLANALQSLGIKLGDRIGTLAWNDHRHLEIYYAVSCIGSVCHMINPRLFPEQVEYIVNHAEDRLIFVDPIFVPLLEGIKERLPRVEKFVVLTDDAHLPECGLKNVQSYESFIAPHLSEFNWPDIEENTASALCYTSGTTGHPKGVLYSHRSTILHSYAAALSDSMNLSVKECVMPIVPMFHVNAWGLPYSVLMVGAKLVFPGSKMGDAEVLHSLIEKEAVTLSAGVPTVWLTLLTYLKDSGKHIDSLKRFLIGGSACPHSIIEEFQEKYDVTAQHVWGMTELSPLGTVNTLKPGMDQLPKDILDGQKLKQGRPIFGVGMKIVDEQDNELPWDSTAVGELKVRGAWVCRGYYGDDKSDAHDKEGWFGTGDMVNIDQDGYMRITDRTKDIIKSGGEWISSIELENVAVGHAAIAEAAVIGILHPKWMERPALFIVKQAGASLEKEELLNWLEERVSKWWLPDAIMFVENLPHTATGKLDKKVLRTEYSDYPFYE